MPHNLSRPFEEADEHRKFELGTLDLITIGSLTIGREILQPGWRWSTHVRPIAGTERCEFHHVGYQISGRWIVEDRDGNQLEIRPGDVYDTPPGHDSWVVGDEPCVAIDFQGIADWAARGQAERILTTVLFADVVDSTALIGRIGDAAWRQLQGQFFERVAAILREHVGILVDTAGDGLLARFDSPVAAVRAARALVSAAERTGLELRAGVHTGEVVQDSNGMSGMAVHLGSRVMAQAGPGEVLVTATVRDLADDAGLSFTEKGTYELKGISGARALYRLEG